MRTFILLLTTLATATAAHAQSRISVPPNMDVPASCRWATTYPADAKISEPRFAAMTSTANCTAMARLEQLKIQPTQAGARELADAMAPSLALLDTVIRQGDLESRIVAEYSRADLLSGMAVALSDAVREPPSLSGQMAQEYQQGVNDAYALGRSWRESADASYRRVAELARQDRARGLVRTNPVVASVVQDAGSRSAPQISRR